MARCGGLIGACAVGFGDQGKGVGGEGVGKGEKPAAHSMGSLREAASLSVSGNAFSRIDEGASDTLEREVALPGGWRAA